MRPTLAALLLALSAAPGLPLAEAPRVLTVAVAANLKPAFEEVAARFQALHPGVEVRPTYGASGTFFAQLANGAPFDLFLSADAGYPGRVVEKGLADGKAFTYALGRLVVWIPAGSPVDLRARGLAALLDPAVKKVALANPEVAPYGRAAREALERAGLLAALQPRLVTGQSVAQAAQFVESGSAQAGFLPLSLAREPPLAEKGSAWEVPPNAHAPIEQAGVIPRAARQPALARELVAFLTGDAGREILARGGYGLPAR
ncbi:MAG: molybdate ABC transporter substrate-binding protein [Anaeromyxobacteraceae bacterium]